VLHKYIEALTEMTNTCRAEVPAEILADALISGGVEILRKMHGAKIAAARLRQTADVVEQRHPTVLQ
jgi:hypothetical protein